MNTTLVFCANYMNSDVNQELLYYNRIFVRLQCQGGNNSIYDVDLKQGIVKHGDATTVHIHLRSMAV